MLSTVNLVSPPLDVPTLLFAAICLSVVLGLFLIFAWFQQRDVRALAWWGAAYLIGGSSMALWSAPAPLFTLPAAIPAALIFVACGMIWNGVRLFRGRRVLPLGLFGAVVWVVLCQFTPIGETAEARITLGAIVVACYTFFIAIELWRERRRSLYSRVAAVVVPVLHAGIFLLPLAIKLFLPVNYSASWVGVFALETMIYGLGTAFIVLLMVKDYHVHIHRTAATTDHLTGLCNRRAFLESAQTLCGFQAKRKEPVTLMMFDLDHFKSINDRFGHGIGDDVLRVFASMARSSMRANDVIGRLGGEEFAAIVPGGPEIAERIAERLRVSFQAAGVEVKGHSIGATVSIGIACARTPVVAIEPLIQRADAALYRAKNSGRNRIEIAEAAPEPVLPPEELEKMRETHAKMPTVEAATSRLLS
jgi:diguanylate cyclase (GGDEF)-like protein